MSQGAVRAASRDKVFGCALAVAVVLLVLLAPQAIARPLYAVNIDPANVAVIDTRTNLPVGSPISLVPGSEPFPLAITPDGSRAYVGTGGTDAVSVIDTRTNTVLGGPIAVGNSTSIAISPDGKLVYVTINTEDSVVMIDIQTNQRVGDPIQVGDSPNGLALTPDGAVLYVCNEGSATVSVIDTRINREIGTIPVGNSPSGVAVTPDGSRAYVANSGNTSNSVSVIDVRSNQVIGEEIAVGDVPRRVAISPDGSRVYIGNTDSETISVIDARTNTTLPALGGLERPEYVAITPDGQTAYTNTGDEERGITALNALTGQLIGALTGIGPDTGQIAIVPNQPPSASFSTRRARPGVPAKLNASASKDSDGTVATYAWQFGDKKSATRSKPTANHVFRAPGKYRVTLTLTDNEGCSTQLIYTGQTAYCNGLAVAATTEVIKVAYPGVQLKCPRSAAPGGCRFKLQAVSKRGKKAKAQTAVARAKIRPGKSTIVSLKPKKAFRNKLARAKNVLVKTTRTIDGETTTSVRRLKIVQ